MGGGFSIQQLEIQLVQNLPIEITHKIQAAFKTNKNSHLLVVHRDKSYFLLCPDFKNSFLQSCLSSCLRVHVEVHLESCVRPVHKQRANTETLPFCFTLGAAVTHIQCWPGAHKQPSCISTRTVLTNIWGMFAAFSGQIKSNLQFSQIKYRSVCHLGYLNLTLTFLPIWTDRL